MNTGIPADIRRDYRGNFGLTGREWIARSPHTIHTHRNDTRYKLRP